MSYFADFRCLTKNTSAVIEVELERAICVELYRDVKDLGRFMLRYGGSTIAAGLVIEVISIKFFFAIHAVYLFIALFQIVTKSAKTE